MTESDRRYNPTQPDTTGRRELRTSYELGRFRDLYDHRNFQRGAAARALLSRRDADLLTVEIDLCRYGVSADRAMCQSLCVIFL